MTFEEKYNIKLVNETAKKIAVQDSLELLANKQAIIDSTMFAQEQQRLDSLAVADSLNQEIENWSYNQIKNENLGAISTTHTSPKAKQNLYQEIVDFTNKSLDFEIRTNVKDDLKEYNSIKDTIKSTHAPFQKLESGPTTFGLEYYSGGTHAIQDILQNKSIVKFEGANSVDKAWPINDKLSQFDVVPSFDEVTIARYVTSTPEIKELIYGSPGINKDGDNIIVTPGFLNILRENNLTGESLSWENKKEWVGSRSNAMQILDVALTMKKRNRNLFVQTDVGGMYPGKEYAQPGTAKQVPVIGLFKESLEKLPPATQESILHTLSSLTDEIYARGLILEERAKEILADYHSLEAKFPERVGAYSEIMTPFDNDDLVKLNELQRDIFTNIDTYKTVTGEDINYDQILNSIAINSLGEEISLLPDSERTTALDDWLINLTNAGDVDEVPIKSQTQILSLYNQEFTETGMSFSGEPLGGMTSDEKMADFQLFSNSLEQIPTSPVYYDEHLQE